MLQIRPILAAYSEAARLSTEGEKSSLWPKEPPKQRGFRSRNSLHQQGKPLLAAIIVAGANYFKLFFFADTLNGTPCKADAILFHSILERETASQRIAGPRLKLSLTIIVKANPHTSTMQGL